ncbi:MAG: SIS domain-containing protein, partial [Candidatus Neomarinimicrobiota bacterium]|nr:SIS domain-containing protein [Candidatus Neomarinimicrobiota bacterium]
IPEMNHNEIVGWQENPKILKQFSILWISDESVHIRNKIRYQSSLEIVNQLPALQKIITLEGNSFPERFIHLLHYGDWLSYWCALMHEIDPTPVDNIDQLKQVLSKTS